MQIRRQDEEFINSLKLFGAVVGSVLAVLLVLGVRNRQVSIASERADQLHQNAPILVLTGINVTSDKPAKENNSVGEFIQNVDETRSELNDLENNFWSNLSQAGLIGICTAAGTAGLLGGYASLWLLSWTGTMVSIKLIRTAYAIIWKFNPDFDGGKQLDPDNENAYAISRDENRILPGIIKITVMAVLALVIFALTVFCITA